ncbi:MAG: tetratricopeptide repeat protein [Xanthobacteraceae bacterium]|nr:tetratricopeptide repeat protein [Xanthobacteraceae bacterium]
MSSVAANRGVVYERNKDFVKARADCERAVQMPTETARHRSAQQLARVALKSSGALKACGGRPG